MPRRLEIFARPMAHALPLLGLALSSHALGATPSIHALIPNSGTERQIVSIAGNNLEEASIYWDEGLPSQSVLSSNLRGANFFSVPPHSAVGSHTIVIKNAQGTSNSVLFNVSGNARNANPRVDDISLLNTQFDHGNIRTIVYVQGANIDVGAKVLADGAPIPSQAHKVLFADHYGIADAALAFPIRHFLSRVAILPAKAAGSTVMIAIENEDGERSVARNFKLPADAQSLDSDGDGISDQIEIGGYNNGNGRINLAGLGANPFRKDIFLELDIMTGIRNPPIPTRGAQPGTIELTRTMFADAPIINPYGENGINLVIDASGRIPYWNTVDFGATANQSTVASFVVLRGQNFTKARRGLFHYAIWANSHHGHWSGESNIDIGGTGVGDSFVIGLSEFPNPYQTLASQVSTLGHELGHDLGQLHGGLLVEAAHTPNYWSIMSYSWQLRTGRDDVTRLRYPTCLPMYYGRPATERGGALPQPNIVVPDYSSGMGPTLQADSLDEKAGVCGASIDWNHDGITQSDPIDARIDPDCPSDRPYCPVVTKASDFANWANLRFDGPRIKGGERQ